MGLSKNHIYTILKAEHLSTEILQKAAGVLGVSITDFFGESSAIATTARAGIGALAGGSGNTQNFLGDNVLTGKGAAEAGSILERLTKCESERESWERERQALQKVIATQEMLITNLTASSAR